MKLVSVNIGKPVPFEHTTPGVTGIFKTPVEEAYIAALGLLGDAIIDVAHHGGLDQAVYLYGQPDYDWWSHELGRTLDPGTFGENLTIDGLSSDQIHIGDRFLIGDVTLEVTSPRIPCRTFAARMGDKMFVKRFLAANRPGLYTRVLSEGTVRPGDSVTHVPFKGEQVLAVEMNQTWNRSDLSAETIARYLATPIHHKERERWAQKLSTP
jgi:MOSC domain-containing protein YiiM